VLTKQYKGKTHYYASLVENKRVKGKVVQTVKANLGAVTDEQNPILESGVCPKEAKARVR